MGAWFIIEFQLVDLKKNNWLFIINLSLKFLSINAKQLMASIFQIYSILFWQNKI